MPCYFCKVTLTRRELKEQHTCTAVYPSQTYAIKPSMVQNKHVIPSDFSSITTCFFCRNYLRKPQQCTACLISVCESCMNASRGHSTTMTCPNKQCGVQNRFQDISRMAKNLLAKLIITCPDCNESVYYSNYDTH